MTSLYFECSLRTSDPHGSLFYYNKCSVFLINWTFCHCVIIIIAFHRCILNWGYYFVKLLADVWWFCSFPGAFQLSNIPNFLWISSSVSCISLWLSTSPHSHSVFFLNLLCQRIASCPPVSFFFPEVIMLSSFVTIFFSSSCLTAWKISSGHLHFTGNGVICMCIPLVLLSVSVSSPSTPLQFLQCFDMRLKFSFFFLWLH